MNQFSKKLIFLTLTRVLSIMNSELASGEDLEVTRGRRVVALLLAATVLFSAYIVWVNDDRGDPVVERIILGEWIANGLVEDQHESVTLGFMRSIAWSSVNSLPSTPGDYEIYDGRHIWIDVPALDGRFVGEVSVIDEETIYLLPSGEKSAPVVKLTRSRPSMAIEWRDILQALLR